MLRLKPISTHIESPEDLNDFLSENPEYFVLQNMAKENPERHMKQVAVEYAVLRRFSPHTETELF